LMIGTVERMMAMPTKKQWQWLAMTRMHSLLPLCHPHWKVKIASKKKTNGSLRMTHGDNGTTSPIKSIYFYHVHKAGGTMNAST
jgi:hypothetical protein